MNYLEENLIPLVLSIKTKPTQSYLLDAIGLGELVSRNGILIQLGNCLEAFWNKVIEDTVGSLIKDDNLIQIGLKNKQIDHLFAVEDTIYYLESKCNLNLDSEKRPASNKKIGTITTALSENYQKEIKYGYFIPCLATIPEKLTKQYSSIDIFGVEWLNDIIKNEHFTTNEFFEFFEEVVGAIIKEKMNIED